MINNIKNTPKNRNISIGTKKKIAKYFHYIKISQSYDPQTDTVPWARKRRPRPGHRAWAAAWRTAAPARSAGRTWRSTRRTIPRQRPLRPSSVPPTITWCSGRKRNSDVPRSTTATGWQRSTGRTWRSPPNCDSTTLPSHHSRYNTDIT